MRLTSYVVLRSYQTLPGWKAIGGNCPVVTMKASRIIPIRTISCAIVLQLGGQPRHIRAVYADVLSNSMLKTILV